MVIAKPTKENVMNRCVFKEHNFKIKGNILPLDKFRLFCDREDEIAISDVIKEQIFAQAEAILGKEYPHLYATEYMMFRKDGNRSIYEKKFFERREDMFTLALAEYIDGNGKYTDKLCDLVWMILEETTWVLPAHNKTGDGNGYLTYAFKDNVDYIDLFSAYTGACLAWVYYLCRDILDEVTPLISERILYELDKKIIKCYLSDSPHNAWWMGQRTNHPNNWDPWINSNVLTVAALTVEDIKTREAVVSLAIDALDAFTATYHSDGGCDEGPSYWRVAGGALYNACLVLYDMSGGYINVFRDPLVVNIAEYVAKAYICGNYYTNFADAPAKLSFIDHWQLDFAELCGSELMESYIRNRIGGKEPIYAGAGRNCPYRLIRAYSHGTLPKAEFTPPKKVWLDGIGVAITREYEEAEKGLYLAFKGGHNAESHNHNDVGNFIVFADGKPVFIDLGVGEYTRKTFSGQRYEIPSMRSEYHNLPTFNGVMQKNGRAFEAKDYKYDQASGALEADLTAAYPKEAGLEKYVRHAVLKNGKISITDSFILKEKGKVAFNLITRVYPQSITENSFEIEGRSINYDASLDFSAREIVCNEVETKKLPISWDTDKLWKIVLSSDKLDGGKKYEFLIEIE